MCQKLMSVGILDEHGRFLHAQVQRTDNHNVVTYPTCDPFFNCVCDQLLEGNLCDVNGCRIGQRFVGISERGLPVCLASADTA
ncbi:hypothetical protein HOLleu_16506 [Holothuria leucospilota]|uniref:Uncharacterized protein n=1 Tax=Holothuria leucospilota TaxID=206669 RepID=A0A9Q1HAN3_HOLLE|nr:hypothetical protein HOLleu_16506 [Holothuria leucospilota]